MAATVSSMIPLGSVAPDFSLVDLLSLQILSLNRMPPAPATVIMFICNHCPYVQHILPKLVEVVKHYQKQGISFIAINSNDADQYPEDHPEKMRALGEQMGFTFPYLYDETQEVAESYRATCTPDFFVFDDILECVYRGQFDDSRPGSNTPVTGASLSGALDHLLRAEPVPREQNPSIGCNIKWKRKGT